MSYEIELAFALRMRGLNEHEVSEVLDEVRAHTRLSGTSPEAEFGTPDGYAEQFPERAASSPGRVIVTIAAVVATIYILAAFAIKPIFGIDARDYVGPIMLWPAVALLAGGIIAGFFTDCLRPAPRPGQPAARP